MSIGMLYKICVRTKKSVHTNNLEISAKVTINS